MDTQNESQSLDNKSLSMLFLAVVIDLLGFGLILPLLPFWAVHIIGAPEYMFGVLLAIFSLFQFIFSPIWGNLSDRIGRRPIILIGLSGSVLSYLILFIGAFYFITSIEFLFIARITQGIFSAATLPTSQAYISDRTSGAERTKNFALIGSAFGIGFAIGPAVGGVLTTLAETFIIPGFKGYWAPALFSTIVALINFIGAYKWLPESLDKSQATVKSNNKNASLLENIRFIKSETTILVLIIIFSIISFSFSNNFASYILLGEALFSMTEFQASIIFFLWGVVMLIIQGKMIGPLTKRYPDKNILITGIFISLLGFIGILFATTFVLFSIVSIILAIGLSLITPTSAALISKSTPTDKQGSILGINQGMGSLMRMVGPLVGASIFMVDIYYPAYLSASFVIICFLFSLILLYNFKGQEFKAKRPEIG